MWRGHGEGHQRRRERVFDKGDFKYVILDLLAERPGHGYELIRRLEERFEGRYTPSPGAVYPALQMLEDMDCVTLQREDGRKVYAITEAGRRLLAERGERVEDIQARMEHWHDGREGNHPRHAGHALRDAVHELRDLVQYLRGRGQAPPLDAEREARIREIIARARADIETVLAEPTPTDARTKQAAAPASDRPVRP